MDHLDTGGGSRLDGPFGRTRHGPRREQLRRLYGDRVGSPTSVHRTAWQDDPFARGAYASMAVGGTAEDHDVLATPVGGVLHLAGEATWTDDPATVTGALGSGHRAATRILGRDVRIERLWTRRADG